MGRTKNTDEVQDISVYPDGYEMNECSLRGFVRDPKTGEKITDNRMLEEIYKRNLMRGNG